MPGRRGYAHRLPCRSRGICRDSKGLSIRPLTRPRCTVGLSRGNCNGLFSARASLNQNICRVEYGTQIFLSRVGPDDLRLRHDAIGFYCPHGLGRLQRTQAAIAGRAWKSTEYVWLLLVNWPLAFASVVTTSKTGEMLPT